MMNPRIGWFQAENKGPALKLWSRLWKDFNNKSGDKKPAIDDDDHSKIVVKMYRYLPPLEDNPSSTYDLENNQHLISKHKGMPWRKAKDRLYEGIDGLHREIIEFYEYIKPKPKEYNIRIEVQTRITKIIELLWPDTVVECFGSFKTNTYLPTSDIDLVVVNHRWLYLPLGELEQHFLNSHLCLPSHIRVLDRASVPIIKMTDFYTGIRINISFNMPKVVKSVNLVNEYLKEFPNAIKLLFVIKQFVIQRDFNEVFRGGLSSYSLVLMVVHFFKTNPDAHSSEKVNLGNLLMRFLDLYGRTLNYEVVGLKVKEGIFATKSEMLTTMEKGHRSRHAPSLLCIEDPLDQTNNVSKNSYNVQLIRDAFRYAFEVLDRAVGANMATVGKTETILGRIIRITDEVIDKREILLSSFCCPGIEQHNPYKIPRFNFRNRGNRGKRYANNHNNNRYNHNRYKNQHLQQNGYLSVLNNQQLNGNINPKFQNNGRNRTGFRHNHDGHNGHHNYINNYHYPRNNLCYYSFDRNPNQHRERAQQQLEQTNSFYTNDVNGLKTEMNGSIHLKSEMIPKRRLRSNTCD